MQESSEKHLTAHYSEKGDFSNDFRNTNLFQLVAKSVQGNHVVDIGCGAGYFVEILHKKGKAVIGIEPNEGLRMLALKRNPEIKILPGSVENADELITNPQDTVTMLDVLEHVEHDAEQVNRIRRMLTSTGRFVIVVPAYQFLYGIRDEQMGHYRRYSKSSLKKLLTENGFSIESIRYWNALGVLPYFISEKLLHRPLEVALRNTTEKSLWKSMVRALLNVWMRQFENRISLGFGLSVICVARKIS